MPKTPLQMLLRGQNLLGYRHYEDGVVDRFVQKAADNGIDVFRVFDALNDIRNLERAIQAVRRTGKHAQGTISLHHQPGAHHRGLRGAGRAAARAGRRFHLHQGHGGAAQAAAGLRPGARASRTRCGEDVRVHVHVHATTGVTLVSLMKAIEAGADCVDTAISSMSLGPGHNPTESLVEMLEGTPYIDRARQGPAAEDQGALRADPPALHRVPLEHHRRRDRDLRQSQIPGGMISNMESQLKQQGAADRIKEVLAEVPHVRSDAGFPPLVTPSSQIVGTQAVFNVMMGRYKVMTGEFADLMLGYYGETIAPRDPEVVELAQQARQEGADHLPARPTCSSRSGTSCATQAIALDGLQRHRRGRAHLRDVPAGGHEVLRPPPRGAAERRQRVGGEAGANGGSRRPTRGAGGRRRPGSGADRRSPTTSSSAGRTHKVTVTPA